MRGAWIFISSCALAGCSLFVSLDDLTGGASSSDAGTIDGASDAAAGDGSKSDGAANDGSTTYEAEILSDSPVGYWRLGDTAMTMVDETTNKLDGTYGPAATPTTGLISDLTDDATSFSGAPDGGNFYVGANVPENPLLEPATKLTIECWFRPASNVVPQGEILSYGQQVTAPFQQYDLQIQSNGGGSYRILFYTSDVGTLTNVTNIESDKTYYLVGTYDGTNLQLFLNGVPDGTGGNAGSMTGYDHVTGLGVGGGAATGEYPFIGTIDEVAIYDHVLTPTRIAAHYAAGNR